MAKLTSFSDFVGGDKPLYNQPKPYIYVIKYIMGKEDYLDELKEYILNYRDEESDYEDDDHYDSFMERLKMYAEEDNIDEIEEMVSNYEDEILEESDDDDDYEERMYNKDYVDDEDVFASEDDVLLDYMETSEDLEKEIESSTLSDKLKDFLKVDLEFEDLEDEAIDEDFIEDEIIEEFEKEYNDDLQFSIEEEAEDIDYVEVTDEEEIMEESRLNKEWIEKKKKEQSIEAEEDHIFPTEDDTYLKEGKKKKKEKRPAYLDKLPVFVHTSDGKKPTKKQLENLVEIIKEEFPGESEESEESEENKKL